MDDLEEIKPAYENKEENDRLEVSEDMRSYIYDMAKWAKFLAIVGFVFCAMIVLSAFSTSAMMAGLAASSPGNPMLALGASGLMIIYLLIGLLQFYPSFLLYKFSTAAMQAVLFGDQEGLNLAMGKLKSFFKFFGILTIVFLLFYILIIVAAVIGIAGAAAI
jgi:hypothetical protein